MFSTLDQIHLGIAFFGGFLGVIFQFSHNKTDSAEYNLLQRLVSAFVALFLTMLIQYGLIFGLEKGFDWWKVGIAGLFFGLGAEWLLRLAMDYQRGAQTVLDFIDRWRKVSAMGNQTPTKDDDK